MGEAKHRTNCSCEEHAPNGFLTSGFRKDGETWVCPNCCTEWAHRCGEASGCDWVKTEISDVALTPKQIQNWRESLSKIIGPFAWIMPAKEIQAMRDITEQAFVERKSEAKPK